MMQHDDVKDLLAAYALGAVTPEEKRAVDVHLMSCDDCRREVADYEEAT
ncbi:MAG: zf-HC2 domain-containing protein, partial [Actinobacteria bacterium]|nr:zf-HC2 domain-containing protein [Actinomycetota bacterium]